MSIALTGDRDPAALDGQSYPPLDGQGRVGLVERRRDDDLIAGFKHFL